MSDVRHDTFDPDLYYVRLRNATGEVLVYDLEGALSGRVTLRPGETGTMRLLHRTNLYVEIVVQGKPREVAG